MQTEYEKRLLIYHEPPPRTLTKVLHDALSRDAAIGN